MNYREPLILSVNYALHNEFRSLVQEQGCKLQYWIECPDEKKEMITDYAFMTFIKNPVFQKYYHGTKAFEAIAADYIDLREILS